MGSMAQPVGANVCPVWGILRPCGGIPRPLAFVRRMSAVAAVWGPVGVRGGRMLGRCVHTRLVADRVGDSHWPDTLEGFA